MKVKATILLLLISVFILFSCKPKEDMKDPCTNGFKNPGETNIDCGGGCAPCPTVYFPTVQLNLSGTPSAFSAKSLTFSSNTYSLNFSNDSVICQINLGSNGAINTYSITPSGTILTKITNYGLPSSVTRTYYNITDASCAISEHNTTDKRMSGFFSLKFFQAGSGNDTIVVSAGEFIDLNY
jgi:hypothetical protein